MQGYTLNKEIIFYIYENEDGSSISLKKEDCTWEKVFPIIAFFLKHNNKYLHDIEPFIVQDSPYSYDDPLKIRFLDGHKHMLFPECHTLFVDDDGIVEITYREAITLFLLNYKFRATTEHQWVSDGEYNIVQFGWHEFSVDEKYPFTYLRNFNFQNNE